MQAFPFFIYALFMSIFGLKSFALPQARYPLNFVREPSLLGGPLGSVGDVVNGVTGDIASPPPPQAPVPSPPTNPTAPPSPSSKAQAKPQGLDLGIISIGPDSDSSGSEGGLGVNVLGNHVGLGPSGVDVEGPLVTVDAEVGSSKGLDIKVDAPLITVDAGVNPSSGLNVNVKAPLITAGAAIGTSGVGVNVDSPIVSVSVNVNPSSGMNVQGTVPPLGIGASAVINPTSGVGIQAGGPGGTIGVVVDSSGIKPTAAFPTNNIPSQPTEAPQPPPPPPSPPSPSSLTHVSGSSDGNDAPPTAVSASAASVSSQITDLLTQMNVLPSLAHDRVNAPGAVSGAFVPPPFDVAPSGPSGAGIFVKPSFIPGSPSPSGYPDDPKDAGHKPMSIGIAVIIALLILLALSLCLVCFIRRYRRRPAGQKEFWDRWFAEGQKCGRSDMVEWKSPSQMRAPTSYGAVKRRTVRFDDDAMLEPETPSTSGMPQRNSVASMGSSCVSTSPDLDSSSEEQQSSAGSANRNYEDLFFNGAATSPTLSRPGSQMSCSVESSHTVVLTEGSTTVGDPFADPDARIMTPPKIISSTMNGSSVKILYVPGDTDSLATREESESLHGYRESYGSSTVVGGSSPTKDSFGYGYGVGVGKQAEWRQSGSTSSTRDSLGTEESSNESMSRVVWTFQR